MTNEVLGVTWVFLGAFFLTSVAIAAFFVWVRKRPWLDVPNDRSTHTVAVPRGAGVPLSVAIIAAVLFAPVPSATLAVGIGGLVVLGALDDRHGLSVKTRLVWQLVFGLVLSSGVGALWDLSLVLVPLGALLMVAVINSTNFMDGINGITALNALVWSLGYSYIGIRLGLPMMTLLALALGGGALAFLPWNIPRARLFLGDSGSYLIGGAVGSMMLMGIASGQPIASFAPFMTYALDTSWSLAKRLTHGHRITEPHRTHVYQRLADSGLPQVKTSLLIAGFSGASVLLGILSINQGSLVQLLILLAIVVVNCFYLTLPRMMSKK